MKIQILTLIAGASLAAFIAPAAVMAQSTQSNGSVVNQLNSDSPNSDPFSQSVEPNSFNMFQLIHNAQLGNRLNPEFAQEQNQQLDDAASEFRKKQQQLIERNQQSQNTQGSK